MKHETRKPGTRKGFAALVALVLILCVTIGGTIAWITAQTPAVTNRFEPAKVSVSIEEDIKTDTSKKDDIKLTNTSDIKAFVRAAVIVNWVKDGKVVYDENAALPDLSTYTLGANWKRGTDGYYYYTQALNPGQQTPTAIFAEAISEPATKPNGAHLEVTILAEAIQADGVDSDGKKAVEAAWGVDPTKLS